ncbi:hypothetical protein MSLAZ_1059 [Methanosarcina lacustris Z-7289]|uniref:Uncharacterized protein n=1 Tax=Methanosarcina lacustris Z-7289 TaxID=1434111 RepID=A0A0E3WRF0_9EURY|nr:hypothetical protein [Methanosarcina lacustris]AKB74320.1 hypothetical protein MSLAZ_1059 [Methanosarcina lacustris Z-7289]
MIMSLFTKVSRKNRELEQKKPGALSKGRIATLIGGALLMIGPASATDVNWSEITSVIDGFVGIVPSFAAMISAVMPIILVIALYTFIIKFWDKILGAIDNAFSGFR